ncbi:MAG: outer membrane lipoprotein carrier protein LolA [Smithella sp.]|nr:outer membrane lipoprotein carrier protein LolA [Smithella sp.]
MTIKTGFLFAILGFLFLPGLAFSGEIPPLENVVQKVQQFYEKTEDLKADFVQETTVQSIKKTEREAGRLFFKIPRNMSWEYTKPVGKKLVINSEKAWLYLKSEKIAYTQKSDNVLQSQLLINFFSGAGKLRDDFNIKYAEPAYRDKDGHYLLVLTPRQKTGLFNALQLTVDKNNFYIMQMSFDDAFGNSTRLNFSNIILNSGLTEKIFRFKPPAGVQVFEIP